MIQKKFTIKPGSIDKPKVYLGADIGKVSYPDISHAWTIISDSYYEEALKNTKTKFQRGGF